MRKSLITFFTLFLFTQIALAQWSNNATVNNAICGLAGEQAIPKIATCPNGDTYIGYFSNESGNYDVRLQRLDSQGNELWASGGILISSNESMTWLTDWDMTADVNNHCVMTWQDIRNGNNNAYAYRISPSGSFVWGSNGIALSNNSAFNASPKVTCTAAGNAVFAWMSDDVLIIQKIDPAGNKQWGDNGITLSTSNALKWPQLMPVGTDEVIMKYFEDSGPPNAPTRHVFAQRYSSTGTPVWPAPAIISDAGGISAWTQIFPFINDGSDGFYIAWHDDRDNNMLASVWVQHISSAGAVLFAVNGVEASTQGGTNHYYPSLACPPGSSDVFVYWNEMNSLQSQKGIFGQKLSSSGTRQWGNSGMTFIPVSATNVTPLAASSSPTDMIVLYEESTSASASSLKAMRIATDGSYIWPTNHVAVSSAASSKVHTVMNDFQNNQWLISWEDNRSGAADIYAQNLLLDGTLGFYDPTFGNIQGQVTLDGGTGNVTQVVVSAGNESTLPDQNGFYILVVPTGTYTVTATLPAYYPGSVANVVVLEDQSTTGVDFLLEAIPTTGFIEGQITLSGGSGEITEVLVTAGSNSTHPNSNGFYSLEAQVGVWDVEASLAGYVTQSRSLISVLPGETTPDIDFELPLLPTTGYVQGYVVIAGGLYDLTEVTVTAGSITTNPNANGFYFLELPVGTFDLTASHTFTTSQTIENIEIEPGLSTTGIDFLLQPLRVNMICMALNQWGLPMDQTDISIDGPESTYTGTINGNSLVFENVPYGLYAGTASHEIGGTVLSDTLINSENHHLVFEFFIDKTNSNSSDLSFQISPNPLSTESKIKLSIIKQSEYTMILQNLNGKILATKKTGTIQSGTYEWPFSFLSQSHALPCGTYFVSVLSGTESSTIKIIVN
jgi:hypothetical protein